MFYTTPENAGIPSAAIERFIDRLEGSRLCMHDFLMVKGGGVLAEAYWKPFHAGRKHRMYSVSKTFVSAAVGMLVDEGKISLNDRIVDHFPDQIGEGVHPLIAEERNAMLTEEGEVKRLCYARPVNIGSNIWFGANVVVCGGVTIGDNCVIGAGSVVIKDIPPNSFAAGNPCRVIKEITEADSMIHKPEIMADNQLF